jgi:hypothetical protein
LLGGAPNPADISLLRARVALTTLILDLFQLQATLYSRGILEGAGRNLREKQIVGQEVD